LPIETVLTSSEFIDSFSTVQPTEILSTSSLPIETVLTSSELTDSSSTVQPTEILSTSSLPIETVLTSSELTDSSSTVQPTEILSTSSLPIETVLTSSEFIDSFSTVQPTEILFTISLPIETVLTSSEFIDSFSTVQPTETLSTSSLLTETVLTSSESTETSSVLLTSTVLFSTSFAYPTEFSSVSLSTPSSSVIPLETNLLPEPCGSGGGWTRLAYLDTSNATQNCPSGFRLYQSEAVRACGRNSSSAGCVSVQFPSNGISYSQICGRVTGYQYGTPNGIDGVNNINSYYVNGVSITRGSPRQHVWTLANGLMTTYNNNPQYLCPCSTGSNETFPSFVGNHYFCESGYNSSGYSQILYTSDPLWDGQGCGSLESPCCNVTGIPWFHRDYGSNTTTDYIELRVCGGGHAMHDEDTPVSFYEIYVK
uniref:Fibrinogen C-terminal domain-containing protein n=1 Tax=Amphimedon queenslandica TaxID=400682 RepID=A0A1X7SVC7_AMPQE